ncbi:MAG: sigma-54 interaction domain-containing protein, partial [Polyangiales bacterium]
AVNCAAIPENLVESEFFGHARGAFTDALQARVGKFQAADGGTIFLDEIGELPLAFQAKLLRLLQERCVTPVGESRPQRIDVRVIAATNRDLEEMVEDKSFREDLFYRLNVIPIDLPPLRERADDIPLLARAFVSRANARQARQVRDLNAEALAALIAYPWPGNIRQLENVIERAVVLKGQGQIALEDLPRKIRDASAGSQQLMQRPELPEEGIDLRDAVEKFENSLILQALERSGWNKNRAATILRMNRTTLVEKLKKKNLAESVASTS